MVSGIHKASGVYEIAPPKECVEVEVDAATSIAQEVHGIRVQDLVSGSSHTSSGIPLSFDTEAGSGKILLLHRPLQDVPGCPISEYFHGKKRHWEIRFQCTFKKPVQASQLRIAGAPFERLNLGAVEVGVQRLVLKIAGPSLGTFYNTPGDDPDTCDGEVENPATSVTVCESDQYISSEEGCPSLCDHDKFSKLGMHKVKGASQYRKAVAALTFQAGETHTFAFWGPARFFHLVHWKMMGVPLLRDLSLDVLNGPPPLVLSFYVLKPGPPGEQRHLESRKDLLCRFAGWSSLFPPPPEVLRKMRSGSISQQESCSLPDSTKLSVGQQGKRSSPKRKELAPLPGVVPPHRSYATSCCLTGGSSSCSSGIFQILRKSVELVASSLSASTDKACHQRHKAI
jgi:hypothetical protein